jgi:hypothetical protein
MFVTIPSPLPRRRPRSLMASMALAAAMAASAPIAAQRPPERPDGVPAATAPAMALTPWGEPDLQGTFTNVYEQASPLERPDQFKGRRREDIRGAELAQFLTSRRDANLKSFDSSDVHAPTFWWADSLAVERGRQPWLIVDPADGRVPPLTAQARQRAAARTEARKLSGRGPADSWEDRSLYDRCITRGLPGSMMPAIYGNSFQIVQAPGIVAIRYEMIHETRVIAVAPQAPLGSAIRHHMGAARARWEGGTLVVETTNFRPESAFRNANADTLRVIERFTRSAPDTVQWTVTIDDPETWTAPWTFSLPLTANDREPVFEYGCHEGNYGLRNILSAARAEERAAGSTPAPR